MRWLVAAIVLTCLTLVYFQSDRFLPDRVGLTIDQERVLARDAADTLRSADSTFWLTYINEELGLEFSYPAEWEKVADGNKILYSSGESWPVVRINGLALPGKPTVRLQVNPKGSGKPAADKIWILDRSTAGGLRIVNEQLGSGRNRRDNLRVIVATFASPHQTLAWQFSFNEDSELGYEPEFREIIQTFKFLK